MRFPSCSRHSPRGEFTRRESDITHVWQAPWCCTHDHIHMHAIAKPVYKHRSRDLLMQHVHAWAPAGSRAKSDCCSCVASGYIRRGLHLAQVELGLHGLLLYIHWFLCSKIQAHVSVAAAYKANRKTAMGCGLKWPRQTTAANARAGGGTLIGFTATGRAIALCRWKRTQTEDLCVL